MLLYMNQSLAGRINKSKFNSFIYFMNIKEKIKKSPFIRGIFYPYLVFRRHQTKKVSQKMGHLYDSFMSKIESGSVVYHANDFLGLFEMGIHSSILKRFFMFNEFEQQLTELVRRHINPSKDIIDVGANIGLFTVLFAKNIDSGRRVLSAEPTLTAMAYLESNVKRNEVKDKVLLYNGVLADRSGNFELHVIPGMEEYSSLGPMAHDAVAKHSHETVIVSGETVDQLVSLHNLEPGFIKIDTEGAEYSVISGAVQTLKAHKPVILSELSHKLLSEQGSSSKELMEMLKRTGYEIFNAYTEERLVPCHFEGEILALPGEGMA